ncbi:MAG TPA: enoyl-CoA hydratase-related protein, partial [Burkholderiaceae bacterium]|nr:enoyl-CoA hydratase-related protein [Burkholderiaceae bacterium]
MNRSDESAPAGFDPAAAKAAGLTVERRGAIALIGIDRPAKRNALSDPLVRAIGHAFGALDSPVRAAVLYGHGEHFCAGLDLSALRERSTTEGVLHSMMWHDAFDAIQFGKVPVIAVLKGA